MNELLNRIFGLGAGSAQSHPGLGFGSPDAELSFIHPIPAWVVAIIVGALILAVWWSYRALPGPRLGRMMLGAMRVVALSLLLALALGPMIEQIPIHTEQDWALVLLDRSGSLKARDASAPSPAQALETRDDQLRAMLRDNQAPWDALSEHKRVVWMGFGDQATTIAIGKVPTPEQLGEPKSRSTNLGAAIQSALDEGSARPISAMVIATDGRSFDAIDPELINAFKSAQIPIYIAALGSDAPVRDLGIAQVEYPSAVFADDLVPIRVRLSAAGISADELPAARLSVDLVDHSTGAVLDSVPIKPGDLGTDQADAGWITLSHTPKGTGQREYDIEIRSDAGLGTSDLNESNNRLSIRLGIVERPMRVLYIDGYPRWEQRYLKNLLLREPSILSSSMLMASGRRYLQEGDELVSSMPATIEDWEPFDVIIIGDVHAELFSDRQLESLLEQVTKHGAGVLWIAGPSANPISWLGSALAPLLPMRADAGGSQGTIRAWDSPVTMRSSAEADRLGLLGLNDERTGWFDRLSDPKTGWSKLYWALELDETTFKPGVSILASASSISEPKEAPIITAMRYGAGRSIFVGTDEIWRWRYGRGEDLSERFWLPIIRSLGRGTVDRRAAPAALSITPTNPAPGKPAVLTLRLFDQAHIDSTPDEVQIQIRPESSIDEPVAVTLRGIGDTRVGTWIPDHPGSFTASPMGLDLEMTQIAARARVIDESDEQRSLDTNHALLAQLAEQTGGKVLKPEDFGTIPSLMPNRTRTLSSPPKQVSLWDRPIVLIALIVLFAGEWIGRRVLRLA